jgi:hypothetical protein
MKSQSRCGELKPDSLLSATSETGHRQAAQFSRKKASRFTRYAENESQTREDKHFTFVKSGTILKMNQDKSERLRYFFFLNRLAKRFGGEIIKYRNKQTEGGMKDGIHSSCSKSLFV